MVGTKAEDALGSLEDFTCEVVQGGVGKCNTHQFRYGYCFYFVLHLCAEIIICAWNPKSQAVYYSLAWLDRFFRFSFVVMEKGSGLTLVYSCYSS